MMDAPTCKRCGVEKTHRPEDHALFEGMHWICFHLEFEHEGDPDLPCTDPSCPWWHIEVFKAQLESMGVDPEQLLSEAFEER